MNFHANKQESQRETIEEEMDNGTMNTKQAKHTTIDTKRSLRGF